MMKNFMFFIRESEWVELNDGFLNLRGSLIDGSFDGGEIQCVEPQSGQRLIITGEGFRPTRAGSALKKLSFAMKERVFVSHERLDTPIKDRVIFAESSVMNIQEVEVSILISNIFNEELAEWDDFVLPVKIIELNVIGFLVYSNGRVILSAFSDQPLEGPLKLALLNEAVHKGVAFEVEV